MFHQKLRAISSKKNNKIIIKNKIVKIIKINKMMIYKWMSALKAKNRLKEMVKILF